MNTRSETFYENKSEKARNLEKKVIKTITDKNNSKHIEIRRDDVRRFVWGAERYRVILEGCLSKRLLEKLTICQSPREIK